MASLLRVGLAAGVDEPITPEEMEVWANPAIVGVGGEIAADALTLLTDLAAASREDLEDELRRSIAATQWIYSIDVADLYLGDGSVRTELRLPMPPLISVESVTFYDTSDTAAVIAGTVYRVHTGEDGRIALRYGQVWPTAPRDQDCIVIAYTGGYDITGATIPRPLLVGIKQLTRFRYGNDRGDGLYVGAGGWKGELPDEVAKIYRRLGRYKIQVVA